MILNVMLTFAITIIATLAYSHNIHSLDLVEVDINNILKNVDKQKQRIQPMDYKKPNSDKLIKLIQKVIQELSIDEKRSAVPSDKKTNLLHDQYSSDEDFNKLSKKEIPNVEPHLFKSHPKQIALNEHLNEEKGIYEGIRNDRNDYSKVYLVLDPDSLSSSDLNGINNLVTSMFSKIVSNKKATFKDRHKGIRHYKGFVIRDNRRRFKEKPEKFAMKSSKEDDYQPKKARGGGGGGGRTAIPYIRHRGNIYEKD